MTECCRHGGRATREQDQKWQEQGTTQNMTSPCSQATAFWIDASIQTLLLNRSSAVHAVQKRSEDSTTLNQHMHKLL